MSMQRKPFPRLCLGLMLSCFLFLPFPGKAACCPPEAESAAHAQAGTTAIRVTLPDLSGTPRKATPGNPGLHERPFRLLASVAGTQTVSAENESAPDAEAELQEILNLLTGLVSDMEALKAEMAATESVPESEPQPAGPMTGAFFTAQILSEEPQTLLKDPQTPDDILARIEPGEMLLVCEITDDWALVNWHGLEGFLPASVVLPAEPAMPESAQVLTAPASLAEASAIPSPAAQQTPQPVVHEQILSMETQAPAEATPEAETGTVFVPYQARTTRKGVNVRKEPDQDSSRVTQLEKGSTVTVLGEIAGANGETWLQIETRKGKQGYIRGDLVERVP